MSKRNPTLLACVVLLAAGTPARAQDGAEEEKSREPGPWSYGAIVGLNLTESSFTDNWAGGDQGSITWILKSDLEAERQIKRKFNFSNTLQLAYGQTAEQTTDASGDRGWSSPRKTTDLIQFESLGLFTLDAWLDPYVGFRLDSQFLDERDPFGRTLMANPIRLKETGGVARVFQKAKDREVVSRVGFGFRQNASRKFTDATGATDATENDVTNDGGVEFQTDVKQPIAGKRIQYKGQLLVFFPFFYNQSDQLEQFDADVAASSTVSNEAIADFWKSPDVNFQSTFDAKLTEWMSVNLYLQLIYDKFDAAVKVDETAALVDRQAAINGAIRKAGQFKQTLAVGLSFRLL